MERSNPIKPNEVTMNVRKLILAAFFLFSLLNSTKLYAFYNPQAQRWMNRDPIHNKGFQVLANSFQNEGDLQRTVELIRSVLFNVQSPENFRAHSSGDNLYSFVRSNPLNHVDLWGLKDCPCTQAPPLPSNSSACDSYGNEQYPGSDISLKCFCKCAGNSQWSQQVRGCLACEHNKGTDVETAHIKCYRASGLGSAPWLELTKCVLLCGGYHPIIAVH